MLLAHRKLLATLAGPPLLGGLMDGGLWGCLLAPPQPVYAGGGQGAHTLGRPGRPAHTLGLVQGVGDLSGHFWALPPPSGAMQAAVRTSTAGLKLVSGPSCPPSAPSPKQTTARSPSDRAIGWAAGPGGYVSACWLRLFHGLAASQPRLAALAQWVGASSGPREGTVGDTPHLSL